jgi:hypothetical protein
MITLFTKDCKAHNRAEEKKAKELVENKPLLFEGGS